MRAALALLAIAAYAQPVIQKTVEPRKFAEAIGRRAMLLGREDGTFEAWINPVKILRDFRLSVYFDGALEPVPLADSAETVQVSPRVTTITHSHAAFTIRQTWVASLDQPVLAVLLHIDTDRPLRLRASFVPEFKPMWPASFGGQSSSFNNEEHALILGEGLRRWYGVVGSPQFIRASEQVGHQLPDRNVFLEMEITPETARRGPIPILITASGESRAAAISQYRDALASINTLVDRASAYEREFESRTMRVTTPDPVLNHAFEWARHALDKGWICNDGVGCGLVAGFGPSGFSERPGFAWYFGGDALMNSWSILDYGDFDRVRDLLAFLRDHQRSDGKVPHELTQSAALLDWSKYPYDYHGDTTPLYLFAAVKYVVRSGDVAFARDSWESFEKAYRLCLTWIDTDGLLLNNKAGLAAVETGALSGKAEKDVYLQGTWLAALNGFARLAAVTGHDKEAGDARARLDKARASLTAWIDPSKQFLPFGKLTDGTMFQALSGWQAMALAYGGLEPSIAKRATATLARPQLFTPWGVRLFATDVPSYDPLSYNDGSVWPFVSGFAIQAQFRNGAAADALRHLYGLASMTGLSGAGFLPEYLSGSRAQALPRSVPHQLFSSSAVVQPLVSGMLGLEGDAIDGTLRVAPALPLAWPRTTFERYRVGRSLVSGVITFDKNIYRVVIDIDGPPLKVELDAQFPPGTRLTGTPTSRVSTSQRKSTYEWTFPIAPTAEPAWPPRKPQVGERAP
jgi:hypothetical protein